MGMLLFFFINPPQKKKKKEKRKKKTGIKNTTMELLDFKFSIPNRALWGDIICNYSYEM